MTEKKISRYDLERAIVSIRVYADSIDEDGGAYLESYSARDIIKEIEHLFDIAGVKLC